MYIADEIQEKVKYFLDQSPPHIGNALGITFQSFKKDELIATMPVDQNTIQPFGILHGGASVTLAESLASIGAWLNLEDQSKVAVGIEINANHIRSVKKGGEVTGIATPLHRGRRIQVWKTEITDQEGNLVCTSRCTLAIVDAKRDR